MTHITGIGGLFFRSKDPDGLSQWYRETLEIGAGCNAEGTGEPDEWAWKTQAGPVVFAPFKDTTDYFPAENRWMINLRVQDINGLLEKLRAKGIAVETRPEWDDPMTGRFARIHDPEDNPIELWEMPPPR